jgi:Tfp pilus assembly protein PilE
VNAAITQIQQTLEKKVGESMAYISTVHSDAMKTQGDSNHQMSCAIQLAINITKAQNSLDATANERCMEHEELKQLVAAQLSEHHQAQDLIKKLSKSHLRTLKQVTMADCRRIGDA